MLIREFSENDVNELMLLIKEFHNSKNEQFDENKCKIGLQEKLKKFSQAKVLVAIEYNNVVGMAQCAVKKSENGFKYGYISNLIVSEEKRRTGIGEVIMREIIDYFNSNHIQSIRLALTPNLDRAAKILFTKLGFQDILHIYELKL